MRRGTDFLDGTLRNNKQIGIVPFSVQWIVSYRARPNPYHWGGKKISNNIFLHNINGYSTNQENHSDPNIKIRIRKINTLVFRESISEKEKCLILYKYSG